MTDETYKTARPNSAGKYRVHGYRSNEVEKFRVWIGKPAEPVKRLKEDTILLIRDAQGRTDQVFANQLKFSRI